MTTPDTSVQVPGGWVVGQWTSLTDGGVTTSDYTSGAISTAGWDKLKVRIRMEATGDPVGVLHVRSGSDSSNLGSVAIYQMAASDPTTLTFTSGSPGITVNDPAADGYIGLVLTDLDDYVGFFWDRTSGGAADGIDIDYQLCARTPGAK